MYPASTTIIRLLLATQLFALAAASQTKAPLALAYGVSLGVGIGGLLLLALGLWWLRRRHKRKIANGEYDGVCVCKEWSGCTKQRRGGNGSIACASCRDVCMKS
jgi:hypothetical protein